MRAGAEGGTQQRAVFSTPLADRRGGVAIAQQRRHQAGQQEGQIVAASMGAARISKRGKGGMQAGQRAAPQRSAHGRAIWRWERGNKRRTMHERAPRGSWLEVRVSSLPDSVHVSFS